MKRTAGSAILCAAIIVLAAPEVRASFLETDLICDDLKGNGGCVVVHDGISFNVFDGGDGNGNLIAKGERFIPRSTNPIQGSGPVDMVITGSLQPAGVAGPGEGTLLAVDQDGDGIGDQFVNDAPSLGVLDAADTMDRFAMTPATDLVFEAGIVRHSFYLTSTSPVAITARATLTSSGGANSGITLDQVGYQVAVTKSGVDDGMAFGKNVQVNPKFPNTVTSLADIAGSDVVIISFPRGEGIRKKSEPDMPAQSVRIDFVYDVPAAFDLSFGTGGFSVDIEYNFIKN